jgi:hypothetical protein
VLVLQLQDPHATATVTFNTIRALQRVFVHLAEKGTLDFAARADKNEGKQNAAKDGSKATTLARFKEFLNALLVLLAHRHDQVKVRGPCSLFTPSSVNS